MVDSNKNKNLIYETNLSDVGFVNLARTVIWCPLVMPLCFYFKLGKIFVRDHSFSTYAEFSVKLTFLTPR